MCTPQSLGAELGRAQQSPATQSHPFPGWLNLEELRKEDGDFNAGGKLYVRVAVKV